MNPITVQSLNQNEIISLNQHIAIFAEFLLPRNIKAKNQSHLLGVYRGHSYISGKANYTDEKYVPVFFHNFIYVM